ncbi:TonB-dependent siderophore receptor [Pararhizobium sp. O133]|uniref:TonB-dependent siderophore receptor n=1 Tax=Pararhizobium sp. O133 TaxID=3449278 RepID=UPI003F687893
MQIKGTGLYRVLMASAAIAVVALPQAAVAQDAAGGATQLERLTVEGGQGATDQEATGPVDGYVAKATGTGSKTATPISEIPQSVSVVGREELADRGVVTKIDEALRYTAGVAAEPFGTDPDTDWFYIRGFDASQTGVFLDGLNLFTTGFGGFQTDAFMLERVEVLKGPASVLYGGSNPGGIINLVSKRPLDDPYYYTEIGINNFGNAFFGFDVNDKLTQDGAADYRVTGKVSGGNNYSDFSEDLRGFILPQVTYSPDDATTLTVYANVSSFDQTHIGNGFLPYVGTVVDAPFGRIDRDAFFGEPDKDTGRYDQQAIGYEVKHEFDNGLKLSQNLRYGHLDKHELLFYPNGYVNTTDPADPGYFQLARIGFEHDTTVDTFAVDNRAEMEFDTGPVNHQVLAGLDYKHFKIDQVQAVPAWPATATPIDPVNPVYGLPQPPIDGVYINQKTTQQQIGLYVQDQLRFGDGWIATLNGRYDYVDTETHSGPTYWAPTQSSTYQYSDAAFSGRAGLAYEFDNGLTPYISVATFFSPVIVASVTPNNKPEEGEQYEAGIKYEPTFIDGLLTASVFQLTKRNVVVTDTLGISTQLGEVTSTGVELEGKVNLNENWKILAAYSYTDLEITEDTNPALVGKRPYVVPEQQAALWLDYVVTEGALEGVSIGGGLRYQGKSAADKENTAFVPDALVADAAIRYQKNDWAASLNVSNLFDKEYVKGCQGLTVCGYGEQRTITLKLSKKW